MSVYTCRRCDHSESQPWEFRCPGCGGLYRAKKVGVESKEQKGRSSFAKAAEAKTVYVPTGIAGYDKVVGGGLVAGSCTLLAGFRGSGKSTLLCMLCETVAEKKGAALYASREEGVNGVLRIANRCGMTSDKVEVRCDLEIIEHVIALQKESRPFLTVYDSLQKFSSEKSSGSPGSLVQMEAVSTAIVQHHRDANTCGIIVNQMSAGGEIKGGTGASHDVETILMLGFPKDDDEDAPDEKDIRVLLCDGKNRLGADNTKAYFRFTDAGKLEEIEQYSKLLEFPGRGKYRRD